MNFVMPLLYGFGFIVGASMAAVAVFIIIGAVQIIREKRRKPFSLNPEWDATRDFIDALPITKKKKK